MARSRIGDWHIWLCLRLAPGSVLRGIISSARDRTKVGHMKSSDFTHVLYISPFVQLLLLLIWGAQQNFECLSLMNANDELESLGFEDRQMGKKNCSAVRSRIKC